MNSYKITSLANATLDGDALNRITADGRFYANTVALNAITVAANDVSLNSHKLTDVSNATLATDALNL